MWKPAGSDAGKVLCAGLLPVVTREVEAAWLSLTQNEVSSLDLKGSRPPYPPGSAPVIFGTNAPGELKYCG